jgi:hypothetical protein
MLDVTWSIHHSGKLTSALVSGHIAGCVFQNYWRLRHSGHLPQRIIRHTVKPGAWWTSKPSCSKFLRCWIYSLLEWKFTLLDWHKYLLFTSPKMFTFLQQLQATESAPAHSSRKVIYSRISEIQYHRIVCIGYELGMELYELVEGWNHSTVVILAKIPLSLLLPGTVPITLMILLCELPAHVFHPFLCYIVGVFLLILAIIYILKKLALTL